MVSRNIWFDSIKAECFLDHLGFSYMACMAFGQSIQDIYVQNGIKSVKRNEVYNGRNKN